jgi:hypothetical protein
VNWFVGDLTFVSQGPSIAVERAVVPLKKTGTNEEEYPDRNPDSELQAKIDRLSPAARKDLYVKLENVTARKKAYPIKPVLIAEPAKLEEIRHNPPVRVAVKADSMGMRNPATAMVNRKKRVEFVKKYLADVGAK